MADMVVVVGGFIDEAVDRVGSRDTGCHHTCACLLKVASNYCYSQMSKVAALRETTIQAVVDPLGWEQAQTLGRRLWDKADEEIQVNVLGHVSESVEDGCYDSPRCGSIIGCACGYCDGTHNSGAREKALDQALTELSKQLRKGKSCSPSSSSSSSG